MSALILALVRPQRDPVAAASFGLADHGIEHHSANALAPSLGNNIDQAQEPRARNHIVASATRAQRLDERHRHGFTTVAADEKPRGGVVISGVVEIGSDLS